METLFGLFDAFSTVGEVLARSEEKDQELSILVCTVASVNQSVRTFADGLPDEDRNYVFNSNQVFPELAKVLQKGKEVIDKHEKRQLENARVEAIEDKNGGPTGGLKKLLTSGMRQGSRTIQEGLEALNSKIGSLGSSVFRLPEDELEVLRQANGDITRLLPQLQLAITSVALRRGSDRGTKRKADDAQLEISADAAAGASKEAQARVPLLHLQLVSDAPGVPQASLSALTTRELRPLSACTSSTTSLDSTKSGDEGPLSCTDGIRLVFGRQELKNKVPKELEMAPAKGAPPQPISRFVSREFLMLEVVENFEAPAPTQEQATLAWGVCDSQAPGDTLSEGCLAKASGLTASGLHLRKCGETRWGWLSKDVKADIQKGDRIAVLLESPPGSAIPGPQKDLEADEATCLLGLELEVPQTNGSSD
eukprot:TRINITY_DN28248_c0_g1_i1.p1 TRINITY_DN28248_c0_g1~~TRINITY_DN28248_c0_g1_i1.p1  ORF type:complete len:440 (+),score=107.04 TRINITY_DN28248_c0_g1_i1:53-1321(+)